VACIFCKKHDKELLCENELAKAFYDNFPVNEGHTLVVPKRHVATYFEATPEELQAINQLIFTVKEILTEKYRPDGYNIGVNVGEAGGQSIFHLHVHVIPRYKGDVKNPRGGIRKIKKSVVPYPLEDTESDGEIYKLVRDKIPDIIEQSGQRAVWRTASAEEYLYLLKEKLWEEVREYSASGEVEELADILEVVRATAAAKGVDFATLIAKAEEKRHRRGGFKERKVLERVMPKNTC